MRLSEIKIGSNRLWYSLFMLLGIVLILSPTIWATIQHFRTVHFLPCENFTVRIPLLWLVNNDGSDVDCIHGVSLIKIAPTLLGSSDFGSVLTIKRVGPNRVQDTLASEQGFRVAHQDLSIVPYSVNTEFNRCLLAEKQFKGRKIVSVFCADEARGIVIDFHGSRHALTEISSMIQVIK